MVHLQVLVTVPQCLGILLLSAEKHGWASRIKNVIFDEVPVFLKTYTLGGPGTFCE